MPTSDVHDVRTAKPHPLDNPALAALLGPHAHLAIRRGQVLRYPTDVSSFIALPDEPDEATWQDAADLLGPGAILPLAGFTGALPAGWEALGNTAGVQLVAMAGERLHPPGWTEISAVCTDGALRGQGLATRLVHAVAAGIRERGETPFLHAAADNTGAIRLYEQLGFRLRRRVTFTAVRIPGASATGAASSNPLTGGVVGDAGAPHSVLAAPPPRTADNAGAGADAGPAPVRPGERRSTSPQS